MPCVCQMSQQQYQLIEPERMTYMYQFHYCNVQCLAHLLKFPSFQRSLVLGSYAEVLILKGRLVGR